MSSAVRRRQQLAVDLNIRDKVKLIAAELGEQIAEHIWRYEDEEGYEYLYSRVCSYRVNDPDGNVVFLYEATLSTVNSPVKAFTNSKHWLDRLSADFDTAKTQRSARSKQRRLELAEQRRRDFGIS